MNIIRILILLLFPVFIYTQSLDSLYNKLMELRNFPIKQQERIVSVNETLTEKCCFGLVASIKEHFNEFSLEKKQNITDVLDRPELQKSIVSPSGLFRIHYDATGYNIPQYDDLGIEESAIQVAEIFDSVYNFEILKLGYTPPPSDGIDGDDELYDVYITSIGLYGITSWAENLTNDGISYLMIDNKMNFYTKGIEAVKVTAAHEFHHAIQLGAYGANLGDNAFYYEITSTSMEEFVYDEINDYYQYLPHFFLKPFREFTYYDRTSSGGGYDRVLWNIFLTEKYGEKGFDIIKRSWENLRDYNYDAVEAIANALEFEGYIFSSVFNDFGIWCYFTNFRTNKNQYFEEATNYPSISFIANVELEPSKMPVEISTNAISLNYVNFMSFDTVTVVLSNHNFDGAYSSTQNKISINLSKSSFSGSSPINQNSDYYSRVEGNFVKQSYIINGELVEQSTQAEETSFVYPQPYHNKINNFIYFPVHEDLSNEAELNIYSLDMGLIFRAKIQIFADEKIVVKWDGKDNNGNKLASGVYIYVTRADGKIKKGKFVILN